MLIEANPSQEEKHRSPILLTDDGMLIEANPSQYSKQPSPKLVTDDGMVIEVKLLHL